MNTRRDVVWLLAVACLLGLLLYVGKHRGKRLDPDSGASIPDETMTHSSTAEPVRSRQDPRIATNQMPITPPGGELNSMRQTKEKETREMLSRLNDVPIVFFGKLLDQYGAPVSGAQITGSVLVDSGFSSGVREVKTISDANGYFRLDGGRGESISINPKKEGYALASTNAAFRYSYLYPEARHIPDPGQPTVISMWRLQGVEPLVQIDHGYRLPFTDTTICFDLLSGRIVPEGGDIRVRIARSSGVVSERSPQDWAAYIEAVEGGVLRSSVMEARVTYSAPEHGYERGVTFTMSTNPPNKWVGGFNQTLFLRSRGGQVYSKVNVGVSINQYPEDLMWVGFRGIANPHGSRNWEADPDTVHPRK